MAVFRNKYDKLTGIIGGVGDNSFRQFSGILFQDGIIDTHQKNEANKYGLLDGAGKLIDHVMGHVNRVKGNERDRRIDNVFDLMDQCEWLRDIVKEMKSKIFLSFKWGEGDKLAEYLHLYLKKEGLDPWKDDKNMISGQNLSDEIATGVRECSLFVCLMSPGYFASDWCKKEFEIADEEGKKIFPIQWKDDNDFKYPNDEFEQKYKDILRHKYNPNSMNEEAEKACALEIHKRWR